MSNSSLSLNSSQYLDGPLGKGEGPDAFATTEWRQSNEDEGWQDGDEPGTPPPPPNSQQHGQVLSSLALIYLRHGDPARAMVLSLAGMAMGDLTPSTILIVAEAMLRAGDPEQAMTVLTRFDRKPDQPGALSHAPNQAEIAARHYITARILHRRGDNEGARAALARSREAQLLHGGQA